MPSGEARRVAPAVRARDGEAHAAARERMRADVREGLGRPQKELPPTYFYDARGSRLFDEITHLPEYYLTRAEEMLLRTHAGELARAFPARTLVELGAGSARKARLLLDALHREGGSEWYVPLDVSAAALAENAARLRAELPGVHVEPALGDMRETVQVPSDAPRPLLFAFLGSTVGNFPVDEAVALLGRIRAALAAGDHLLLGADLVKDRAVLEAAYNDARGVTAEFNRNVLRVLNRELGADFDVEAFEHRATYDEELRRIEMHLVASAAQRVTIPGVGVVPLARGESIRTEVSCKYDRASLERMLGAAGFAVERWMSDDAGYFALVLARTVA